MVLVAVMLQASIQYFMLIDLLMQHTTDDSNMNTFIYLAVISA